MHRASPVSPVIAQRARQHRCAPTPEEQRLWLRIRGCQLGVWFRAQVPVGGFIVDFLAPNARVVVEVDGGYHIKRRASDERRDAKLARMGYRVLRLAAEMVSHRIEKALERIRADLARQ